MLQPLGTKRQRNREQGIPRYIGKRVAIQHSVGADGCFVTALAYTTAAPLPPSLRDFGPYLAGQPPLDWPNGTPNVLE